MSDDIRELLSGYAGEALDLRFAGGLPGPQSAPKQILDALLDVRRRLDRVEALLGRAVRIRARCARASAAAKAAADDAWDRAAQRGRSAPVARGDEFSSARERHADANLAVLDERRAAREAAGLADHADEAVEVLRLAHRGLADLRQDVMAILRALQFESHLDR